MLSARKPLLAQSSNIDKNSNFVYNNIKRKDKSYDKRQVTEFYGIREKAVGASLSSLLGEAGFELFPKGKPVVPVTEQGIF